MNRNLVVFAASLVGETVDWIRSGLELTAAALRDWINSSLTLQVFGALTALVVVVAIVLRRHGDRPL